MRAHNSLSTPLPTTGPATTGPAVPGAKIPCVQYLSNKNNSLRFKAAFSAGGALNPDFEEHVAYYGTLIEAAVAAAG